MRSGELVAGRFEIDREVAAGGMGRVFLAKDKLTGQDVAVKVVLHPDAEPDPRFLREAVVLADVKHPAVVAYVAHGETSDGNPFLAMEWLDGEDLSHRLKKRLSAPTIDPRSKRGLSSDDRLSAADIITLTKRIAGGLAALHERGLVHRDIKPSNVFLPHGDVASAKLLDFGLARHGGRTQALTQSGVALGTPSYMAPEQVRGLREIDARVDVWALGCLIFECFTGGTPFRKASTAP